MPFPGSRVIHARWSEHHRPTATGGMTATCTITRAMDEGTTGPDGTWTPPAAETIYTGPCRVVPYSPVGGEKRLAAGDEQTTRRGYQVALAYDTAEIHVGDTVTFTDTVDATLIGKQMRVADMEYGSEQWQRDLLVNEIVPGQ